MDLLTLTMDEHKSWGEGTRCWILGILRTCEEPDALKGAEAKWYSLFFLVLEETGVDTNEFRRIGLLALNTEDDVGISEPGFRTTLVLV
ncbi:hypothetical protein QBC44DRAFT_372181 [Cladorrhinum sp. PSN332]|nr:hypothetical protein QBC44DRAFT_372181 [Cladorrhinum sp. PSN332]